MDITTDTPDHLTNDEAIAYRAAAVRAHGYAEGMLSSHTLAVRVHGLKLLSLLEQAAPGLTHLGR